MSGCGRRRTGSLPQTPVGVVQVPRVPSTVSVTPLGLWVGCRRREGLHTVGVGTRVGDTKSPGRTGRAHLYHGSARGPCVTPGKSLGPSRTPRQDSQDTRCRPYNKSLTTVVRPREEETGTGNPTRSGVSGRTQGDHVHGTSMGRLPPSEQEDRTHGPHVPTLNPIQFYTTRHDTPPPSPLFHRVLLGRTSPTIRSYKTSPSSHAVLIPWSLTHSVRRRR